jgi:hypothetical protein
MKNLKLKGSDPFNFHGYISMRLDGNLIAAEDTVANVPRHKAILLSLIDGICVRDS